MDVHHPEAPGTPGAPGVPDAPRTPGPALPKPPEVFDRDAEWAALADFARDPRPGSTLGVVSGRSRQGKTFLLEALTRAADGFYFAAQEAAESESLQRLADELARHTGAARPARWTGWDDALDALLALGADRPVPVVLDEFPHLVRQSPALPSTVLRAWTRDHDGQRRGRARLLLSGSALSVMNRLFSATSPLHGLAALRLSVGPLGFRRAARLWGADDPHLAVLLHSVVGGTPAYRYAYVRDDAPAGPGDFDAWVVRTVLEPRVPLFHEAAHLVEEEPALTDRAVCHSVLAAVAAGCTGRGDVAVRLGLRLEDVSHALVPLQDCGLIEAAPDAFQPHRVHLCIAEPLLAFEHAVLRPHRSRLEQEPAARVWAELRGTFRTRVVGPHFTRICREWVLDHAGPGTFPGEPAAAGPGTAADSGRDGAALAVDLAVRGPAGRRPGALLSVGTTAWDRPLDLPDLAHLRRALDLLAVRGEDTSRTLPALYGAAGFTPALEAAAARGEALLVDPDRLYHGS
ncbi:ATP-binding protein [Streptomyces sp. NPDC001380]|uniref:AAA family ATPase n=1 Tax=Streptomyces sp. NPDC001380 TaxID=3364566 RepID=UPI0036B5BFC0